MIDDLEIGRLVASIETQYETETIRKREFLLEHFTKMKLAGLVEPRLTILRHRFGKQMTSIARRYDADTRRPGFDSTL